jgi:hypothetical protein
MESLKCSKLRSLAKIDGVKTEPADPKHTESRSKEKYMRRLDWYLGSFLLGAALIAPVGIQAKDKDKDHNCPANGYYDRDHKDCHNWDDHESRAYQTWEEAQHKARQEFSRLKAKEQSEYWKWRHEHPDDDKDRH